MLGVLLIVVVVVLSFTEEFTSVSKHSLGYILCAALSVYPFAIIGAPLVKAKEEELVVAASTQPNSVSWRTVVKMMTSRAFVYIFIIFTLVMCERMDMSHESCVLYS